MTAVAPSPETAVTRRRGIGGWVAIVAGIVIVGLAMTVIAGIAQLPARGMLDPDAAGPEGTRAVARILERQGVEVVLVRDRDAARRALADGDATLAWGDTSPLADETVRDVSAAARDVVLLDPAARDLRVLLPGAAPAGYGQGTSDPACPLAETQRSGPAEPGALFRPGEGITACYPAGDGEGLLVDDAPQVGGVTERVAAIDATVVFTNERLATAGHAALALNLLGRHALLVWYLPGLTDSDFADTTPTLGDLTPPWVTPSIVLLIIATLAAGVWRGRRFGPLVTERLPVTVRAGETTEGRARLYARAGEPLHAADELRIATLRRLARALGLGPAASAPEISDAVATRLGIDRGATRAILVEDAVHTDRELVEVADRLRELEDRLHRSLHPVPPPASRPDAPLEGNRP
jgi:hypothetical protein